MKFLYYENFTYKHRLKSLLPAIAATFLLLGNSTNSKAADLGGDCCADLEERVAILEATTARKGNRKVSLKISGWVNQALLVWDDGHTSDAYVVDNVHAQTRFRFTGSARINSDWSAGYEIEMNPASEFSIVLNQNQDDAGLGLLLATSNWWIASKQFGKVTVGQQATKAFFSIIQNAPGSGLGLSADPTQMEGGFFLRQGNGALSGTNFRTAVGGGEFTLRQTAIQYETPTVAGFILSAAWGEDDHYEAVITYAGNVNDLTVNASLAYVNTSDVGTADTEEIKGSVSVLHKPTGLFITGSYREILTEEGPGNVTLGREDGTSYYLHAGIKQRWNSLGATLIGAEYYLTEDYDVALAGVGTVDDVTMYGVNVVQWIDEASMQIYAYWRRYETDLQAGATDSIEDFDSFVAGGVIFF